MHHIRAQLPVQLDQVGSRSGMHGQFPRQRRDHTMHRVAVVALRRDTAGGCRSDHVNGLAAVPLCLGQFADLSLDPAQPRVKAVRDVNDH